MISFLYALDKVYVMGLFDMWREARGNVVRKELEDVLARTQDTSQYARFSFLNNFSQAIEPHGCAVDQHRV